MYKNFFVFFIILLFYSHPAFSQNTESWKSKYELDFLSLLKKGNNIGNGSPSIELWTVSPGLTITNAFGHSAFRINYGEDYSDRDYYVDFGVYDESPGFFWRFLRGEAKFYINIIPTSSAYQAWDASGRGVTVTKLLFTDKQKELFFKSLQNVISRYKNGYDYENFTQNCVTFLRGILSESQNEKLSVPGINSENNTWRKRVQPYSKRIFWLNFNETLLFDNDTDEVRDSFSLIYLPNDLLESVKYSKIKTESYTLIKERILLSDGSSGDLWKIIFIVIVLFSLPFGLFKSYNRISETLFATISTFSATYTLMVFTFTSFSFMNETIAWLIYSPLDFIFYKKNTAIKENRFYRIIFKMRLLIFILISLINIFYINQDVYNISILCAIFYILYSIKYKMFSEIL